MSSCPGPRILVLLLGGCFVLSPSVEGAPEATPRFRPALVGNGPRSLVNLIDVQKLLAKKQGDGVVMFDAAIEADNNGSVSWIWCHAAPGSETLKEEVTKELRHASFIPALINGKEVDVVFYGTVIFTAREGRPYLRVFANQDRAALAQQSDLIQPQMLLDSEDWEGAKPLLEVVRMHARTGHAVLSVTVEVNGKVRDVHLVREEPTRLNIGAAALKAYATAKFIPAFRNGKPVTDTFESDWAVRGYRYRRW